MNLPRFDFSAIRQTMSVRNFAVFTAGNAVSLVGTWVQRLAVGWLTWELTKSAAWLGAVSMAEFLPVIFLAPFMGVMADRFDRRRLAVIGQVIAAVQSVILAALTLSGNITAVLILALQIFAGLIQPLIQTARLVLVPSLVPRENVPNAVAITSMMFNVARIIGPAVSGVLITTIGAGYSFAFNAATYTFVIAALMYLKLPAHEPPPRTQISLWQSLWTDLVDGWRYTFTHPTMKWVIPVITVAATLSWPVTDLLAGIADHEFDRGAGGLAILTSAHGFGAIIGTLYLAQRGLQNINRLVVRSIILNGLFMAAFALTKNFWLATLFFTANGMTLVMGGASSQTAVQTASAEHMRGRTLSIWYTLTRVGLAAGALVLGAASSVLGFTSTLFTAGLVTAGLAYMIWRHYGAEA